MRDISLSKPSKKPVIWKNITLMAFDCDGVLTDGRIVYSGEILDGKNFHAHDGLGFGLLNAANIITVVITGRTSKALQRRCNDLNIKHLFQGIRNKEAQLQELLEQLKLNWSNVLYMGDDWNDVPCMRKAAVSVAPGNAPDEIQRIADYITDKKGGHGAVRECIDIVLRHKGIYEKTVAAFLQDISS